MSTSKQTTHSKWASTTTEDIQRYITKYLSSHAPGKCSAHRRKKVKFLKAILVKRDKTIRLLMGNTTRNNHAS